ncbi:MAG TPA: regulatory protein RecX [Dehalococcoidia bacterium]|jgi:SOS response regulatory protein OraA/RecX|nr:regulatory protein RecX [Dehalococcoidia bacterium]
MTSTAPSAGSAPFEEAEQHHQAVRRALEIVSRRHRTESDLRERLAATFPAESVEHAIARLRELRYIDDAAWAVAYVARDRCTQMAASALRRELLRNGVDEGDVDAALALHDDGEAARYAVTRRLPALRRLSEEQRSRRLASHLQRRGFDWTTVSAALSSIESDLSAAD